MKRKLVIFAVILLTLFNLTALTTIAYQRWTYSGAARDIPDERAGMRDLSRLGFDDEQISRMRDSRRLFLEQTEPLETELHQLRSTMFELVRTESVDTAAIFALVDSIGAVQNRLQKMAIAHMLNEGPIFTPEQRRRFFEMLDKHKDQKWRPHGHRGHGKRGGMPQDMRPIGGMTIDRRIAPAGCGYRQSERELQKTAFTNKAQGGY